MVKLVLVQCALTRKASLAEWFRCPSKAVDLNIVAIYWDSPAQVRTLQDAHRSFCMMSHFNPASLWILRHAHRGHQVGATNPSTEEYNHEVVIESQLYGFMPYILYSKLPYTGENRCCRSR